MWAPLLGLKTISPPDLLGLIREKQVITFDVNSPQSWNAAHVPGALNMDPADTRALPADKTATLVFYCSNLLCRKAPFAARRAKLQGYTDVRVMSVGISGWLDAGFPTESA